jgi:HEAT repeat protein
MTRRKESEADMNSRMTLFMVLAIPLAQSIAQTLDIAAGNPVLVRPGAPAPVAQPMVNEFTVVAESMAPPEMLRHPGAEHPGNQDDPAYAAYKEGYRLILDERWQAAREKLADVLAKYKKSSYRADASYWSAYALKHINFKTAQKAYEEFLRHYPRSSYFDDAVADLAELQARGSVVAPVPIVEPVPVQEPDSVNISVSIEDAPYPDLGPTFRYSIKRLGHGLQKLQRISRHDFDGLRMMVFAPDPGALLARELQSEKLDRKTRLKIQALSALGELKEDPQSVTTLKEIALDRTQPRELRHVALYSLSRYKDADMLPVFVEIARKDTDAEIQGSAVYCIANSGQDKSKTLDMLTEIYRSTPEHRTEQLETVLEAIAVVGTDKGVDFLSTVARTSNDPELASTAIDGIGQAAENKDKVVGILISLYGETPKARIEQRETILYTIADIGNERAIDFLSTVALSEDDFDLRSNAIYLLGTIGGEKARTTIYRVLKGK